ncbi:MULTISPECIES: hypothetical protein [unclassified Pseudomonas]|uniref:hypothetical protein n=1 Tax=unclassified Pseudomonas TaxID=196821 RepID=UPI000A1E2415|nr:MULTISPECIES: hypothetical protein [unclassified Pseudomonas]
MTTIRKNDEKTVCDQLSFLDVRQAASDGKKAFDEFVTSGKLPVTEQQNLALLNGSGSLPVGGAG